MAITQTEVVGVGTVHRPGVPWCRPVIADPRVTSTQTDAAATPAHPRVLFERRLRPRVRDLVVVGERARCLLTSQTGSALVDVDLRTGQEVRRVEGLPRMGRVWCARNGHGLGIRRTAAVGRGPTHLTFLDPDGRFIAASSVPDATSQIAAGLGCWYVGCRNGHLYTFTWDGRLCGEWETPGSQGDVIDVYTRPCPYLIASHPLGVVVSSFAHIYVVGADGQTRWHAELPQTTSPSWSMSSHQQDEDYGTLGLSPGADDHSVKSAYRQQARATHPDRHPDDPDAATKFATVRQAYERLVGDVSDSEVAPTLTFAMPGFGPTVTTLATMSDTVVIGTSDGRVYEADATSRLQQMHVLGDRPVGAARRQDGTLGAIACGQTLLLLTDQRLVPDAPLIFEPRRLTMVGETVVLWNRSAIQVVDATGRAQWAHTFPKPLTHVVSDGDVLLCVAGTLMGFRAT